VSLLALSALKAPAFADKAPRMDDQDRIRVAEAFRLADSIGDRVWPGWKSVRFAVLLVTPTTEFLIRHPSPGAGFVAGEYDSLLGSRVYSRPRVFPATFQATFPVEGVSTVVIGSAASMQPPQNSTRWLLTSMHEHFHQWQDQLPGAQAAIDSLKLARGDSTGMWMLNYPFPYGDSTVARAFDEAARAGAAALRARGTPGFDAAYAAFDGARVRFESLLRPDDARYMAFQLWKEGVARYTELDVARTAAAHYQPSDRFRALPDFKPFDAEADAALGRILHELDHLHLPDWQRVVVYPFGATEALLLDEKRPGWKADYARERFRLDRLMEETASSR
jgi:hypothetical protein